MGLAVGVLFGAVNGVGIVFLGLPPIVMTLAMNGILEGLALLYCNGTPSGFASPAQRWFMTGHMLGLTPVVWFLVLFVAAAVIGLSRTPFGRRIYAVGNSVTVARLSAVGGGGTIIGVYALSGFCSALVGILLSSLAWPGQSRHGRHLPSALDRDCRRRRHADQWGQGALSRHARGALLLTAISTLLAGTALPDAVRDIIFGLVVLTALLAMRERQA